MAGKYPKGFAVSIVLIGMAIFWAGPVAADDPETFTNCCCKYVDQDQDGSGFPEALGNECQREDLEQNQFCEDKLGRGWENMDMSFLQLSMTECHIDWMRTRAQSDQFKSILNRVAPGGETAPPGEIKFTPQVTIPELGGTPTFKQGQGVPAATEPVKEGGAKVIYGTLLSQYLWTWYRLLIYLAGFLAMVMIVWGGFKWMWGAGSEELIGSAKTTIVNAVMGLLLAFGAYLVLAVVNPNLIQNKGLRIRYVETRVFEEAEHDGESRPIYGDYSPIEGMRGVVAASPSVLVPEELQTALAAAADRTDFILLVTSGYRQPAQQQVLIAANCPSGARRSSDCTPPTCLMLNGRGACPHTSGRALDVWGADEDNTQCISQKECLRDVDACRQNPCQQAIGQALEAEGFCNISSEPWHFEYYPSVSPNCRSIYTFGS